MSTTPSGVPLPSSCYLYAVARPSAGPSGGAPAEDALRAALAGLRGVAGSPVLTLFRDGLLGVVSEVPEDEFTEEALHRRLEDLGTLEELARAHHSVVDAVARVTAVLPLRLATVYRDRGRVAEVLHQRREAFHAALDQVAGRSEWGVKVYAVPETVPAQDRPPAGARAGHGAAVSAQGAAVPSGRDYLRQRMRRQRELESGRARAAELAARADTELSALADGVRHHRPQDPRLSGQRGENVLNAAYLVRAERLEEFIARVAGLRSADPAARLELTGPWAPYSFAPAGEPGQDERNPA